LVCSIAEVQDVLPKIATPNSSPIHDNPKPRGEGHMTDRQPQVHAAPFNAEQTIERLTARLARVERQLKGLQFAVPGLVILAVAAFAMQLLKPPAVHTQTVVAETLGVKNSNGDVVVRLGTTADGAPSMSFFDAQQKIRLMVGLSANGRPSLSLIDPQQVPRGVLSLNDQFDPSLTMFNAEKLPRSVFSIDGGDTGGSGHLILYGTGGGLDLSAFDGRVRWNPRDDAPVDIMPAKK
jgi:hypothetical protein